MNKPKYFDCKCPVSFGGIDPNVIPIKTVTRRHWKDSYVAKYLNAYDSAQERSAILRIPAIDKGYYAKGKQIGWMLVNKKPYQESLANMPHSDLLAEGGMCKTLEAFINQFFGGNSDLSVWVIRYQFVLLLGSEHE